MTKQRLVCVPAHTLAYSTDVKLVCIAFKRVERADCEAVCVNECVCETEREIVRGGKWQGE